jgi:hypothetical protein
MNPIYSLSLIFLCSFVGLKESFALDVSELINFAEKQYTTLAASIPASGAYISTGDPLSATWRTTNQEPWTAGFYSGSLWMLYKHTGATKWRDLAILNQDGLFGRQFDTGTHDVGFVIMSSYGHGLELTGIQNYGNIVVQAATSLLGRFFKLGGVIRSWNNNMDNVLDEVKVIIDNMMNLELLFKASELTGDSFYARVAISHAEKTLAEHFRPDGGSYHVVSFYEATGGVKRKFTWQGYSASSTWARGHAWGINGFTTTYKYTNDTRFLAIAERAAEYFINHLEPDFVPIWDFDAPTGSSYQPRDTSAAAVAACAFLELHTMTSKQNYFDVAEKMLESLAENYRADVNPNYRIPALLVNGTVFFNSNDFDTSITYGDYYFLKALDLYDGIVRKH